MTSAILGHTALDVTPLVGTWRNTNAQSRGITRFFISPYDGGVAVHAWGSEDWGSVPAHVYVVDHSETTEANAFSATFDFGFLEVRLQVNIKGGVLVVASFNEFKDASGRSSYFSREFYARSEP